MQNMPDMVFIILIQLLSREKKSLDSKLAL